MALSRITPLILAFNEAPNIGRSLDRLAWAREILLVDSFSTDDTLAIARRHPAVRIVQRQFDSFAGQCNFGLQQIASDWVLSLDADYMLSDELVDELRTLDLDGAVDGYRAGFRYCVAGRPLRASLYPPRVVLYRRRAASYRDIGHGHRVDIRGPVQPLRGVIDHDDRKPLDRWLREQDRYMLLERTRLLAGNRDDLDWKDRVRRWLVPGPCLVFLYLLLWRRLILDGWPGWYYVWQRTVAEMLLSLRLLEAKVRGDDRPT